MAEKRYDVIHIGEANHDIRVPEVPDAFFTQFMETGVVGRTSDGCGGDAQNQAICTAALGNHSAFYGRVCSGYPGLRLKELLEEAGVDTSLMILADDCVTSDILCLILKDGSHRFLTGERRNWGLKEDEIDPAAFAAARALSIGSLFALDSLDRDGARLLEEIFKVCKQAGTLIVADMNLDVFHLGPRHYDGLYRYIDYMVPSLDEARYVTGDSDERRMADFFLQRGAAHAIIKLGADGCYVKSRDAAFYQDPFDIVPRDTTGCGDNFTGGLVHALLKGASLEESVRFASATAALHATGIGSSGVVRSERMVLDFMEGADVRRVERRAPGGRC